MSPNDREYYRARAEEERQRSAEARTEEAADIHLRFALLYEQLVQGLRPAVRVVRCPGNYDRLMMESSWARLNASAELLRHTALRPMGGTGVRPSTVHQDPSDVSAEEMTRC